MREFKYPELIRFDVKETEIVDRFDQVQSGCLKPCASAFKANAIRTGYSARLPAELCYQSYRNARLELNALFRTTGRGYIPCGEIVQFGLGDGLSPEEMPQFIGHFQEEAESFSKLTDGEKSSCFANMGVRTVELLLADNKMVRASMDALFVSIVLESWLFFEAFASDLWVACVDNAGKAISNRLGVFSDWTKPEEKISPDDALKSEFNAKTHYGSYLREMGKVSFIKLGLIRKFFGAAFGTEAERLFDGAAGGRILMLSKVRNCIVHSAGKIDKDFKKFLEQTPRFPELGQFKDQTKIELDGAFVRTLRQAAWETGLALIQHADAVLQSGG